MTDVVVAGEGLGAAPRRRFRPFAALAATLAAEGERRALWLPVAFGAGIAVYFDLTREPPTWLGVAAAVPAIAAAVLLRRRGLWGEAALALALFSTGFALIQQTTRLRAAPMLDHRLGAVSLTGRVVDVDLAERGWRLILAPDPLPRLAASAQPAHLRIHIAPSSDALRPGDRVSLKAMIYPVPGQVMPGGRDLQREAFFARIGGVGYSLGGARRVGGESGGGWRQWLLQLRTDMTRRIGDVLPGSTGGVASAVITGKRGAMAEEVKQSFRDSGLSHLLAIAGLHLGLVGGFVFFAVRGGLALIPYVALRLPIKKIAAAVTLVVLFCYLMLSGAAIPTQRAFVMNGIVFAAILIDRLRISMRICAIAAFVVLLVDPASLAGVSFAMSFGAVVALIAMYETYGARLGHLLHGGSFVNRILGYCGGIAVTTLVATLGTEPFAIYHFHHLVLYSPLANVLAVPVSALWTLPWAVVSCLLMPLGLERLALVPMGWGIDLTIWIARGVGSLPGNVWATPEMPPWGIALVSLGGLWLCVWRGGWRLWGMIPIAAGLASLWLTRPPDIVIADFGRFLATRTADGAYAVSGSGERMYESFLTEQTGAALVAWPPASPVLAGFDCAGQRCFYTARGRRVAIVTGEAGLPIICGTVDAIVSQVPAGFRCRSEIPVVDRIDVWRQGAVVLWLDSDKITVSGVNASRGNRPWVPQPKSRREREAAAGRPASPAD
ncbi:MAG TPA: ComEC/Rec2 family competence protein [Stellaceae bacterium]|nr:ComEC/Rec2 family competence protein [Stellaceae bacterium]